MSGAGSMTESCWGLVPIKTRTECKNRLAGKLAAETRLSLVRIMLERVLLALREARTVDRVAIVSPERDTAPPDVPVFDDPGHGLNAALDAARRVLVNRGATELVVLPADLPLVTAADIDALVELGRRTGFAVATDAMGLGTNGLYLSARAPFRFQFGADSRRRHVAEAIRRGLKPELVEARNLEFDLDLPEDLIRLQACADPAYASLLLSADGGPCLTQMQCG